MEFFVLYEDAMRYHDLFMRVDQYRTYANAIRSQRWLVDGNNFNPEDETDKAIVICLPDGVVPPRNKNGSYMWHEKYGLPRIDIQAPADTSSKYTLTGTFHPIFVESVLLYVYAHALRGEKRHLFGIRSGRSLSMLLVDFKDKDKILQGVSDPQTHRQNLLRLTHPQLASTFAMAIAEDRRRQDNSRHIIDQFHNLRL